MRATPILIAAAAALLAGCNAAPPGQPLHAASDPDAIRCREVLEPPSNVVRELCLTEAQWRQREDGQRRAAQDYLWDVFTRSGIQTQ